MASIETTDTSMVSDSGHTATTVEGLGPYDKGAWVVSWCPHLSLDRNQAITALTIAEFATTGVTGPTHRRWPVVQGFAAELGMDPDVAVRMVLSPKKIQENDMQEIKDGTYLVVNGSLRRAMGTPQADPESGKERVQHCTPEDWEAGLVDSSRVNLVTSVRVLTDEAAANWDLG